LSEGGESAELYGKPGKLNFCGQLEATSVYITKSIMKEKALRKVPFGGEELRRASSEKVTRGRKNRKIHGTAMLSLSIKGGKGYSLLIFGG